jgi:peptidoglycan/LPS O-acetylase OafA/YrhL
MKTAEPRIVELDSLRGLAALAVVFYHFTSRYDQLFGHASPPAFQAPWGEYGVDVFFILSGLMILRSLERAPTAIHFAVARFARLYPAYWAAAGITFAVVWLFGLPGQEVSIADALWNVTMLQQLFGARSIDGAYWSLQVELFFYAGMLVLHRAGALGNGKRLYLTVAIWLLAALAYHAAIGPYGLHHPWATRLLNKVQLLFSLHYAHLFALGVLLYHVHRSPPEQSNRSAPAFWLLAVACCLIQGLVDSWTAAALIAGATVVVHAASIRQLSYLAWRPLVLLGTVSYSLYLIHQNVGYVVMRLLENRGLTPTQAVAAAVTISLVLAVGLSFGIEQPAQRWFKSKFANILGRFTIANAPALRQASDNRPPVLVET